MDAPVQKRSLFHTLLVLGRVSNLPTVWSNCLVGWLLTGEPLRPSFALLLAGATCLYTGGMFLNDACDVEFDRQHRRERPIPSGWISQERVGVLAMVLLGAGGGFLAGAWHSTLWWTVGLMAAIVAYNALHKLTGAVLVLMGVCRALLYPLAATAAVGQGIAVILPGTALGLYVLGISLVARGESTSGNRPRWTMILMLVPIPLAIWGAIASTRLLAVAAGLLLILWVFGAYQLKATVSGLVNGLLAGIVLVDLLFVATVPGGYWSFPLFGVFLALALLLQRWVPAT